MSETKREFMQAAALMLVFLLLLLCSSVRAEEEKTVNVKVNVYISRPDLNTRTIDVFKKTTPAIKNGDTTDLKLEIDTAPGEQMRIEYDLYLPEGKDLIWSVRVNGRNHAGTLVSKAKWQMVILHGEEGRAYDIRLDLLPVTQGL